jgi:hypothetical protein
MTIALAICRQQHTQNRTNQRIGLLKGRKACFFVFASMYSLGGEKLVPQFLTVKKGVRSEMNAGFSPPFSYGFILLDGG